VSVLHSQFVLKRHLPLLVSIAVLETIVSHVCLHFSLISSINVESGTQRLKF
jgi:hypothetical protein